MGPEMYLETGTRREQFLTDRTRFGAAAWFPVSPPTGLTNHDFLDAVWCDVDKRLST